MVELLLVPTLKVPHLAGATVNNMRLSPRPVMTDFRQRLRPKDASGIGMDVSGGANMQSRELKSRWHRRRLSRQARTPRLKLRCRAYRTSGCRPPQQQKGAGSRMTTSNEAGLHRALNHAWTPATADRVQALGVSKPVRAKHIAPSARQVAQNAQVGNGRGQAGFLQRRARLW